MRMNVFNPVRGTFRIWPGVAHGPWNVAKPGVPVLRRRGKDEPMPTAMMTGQGLPWCSSSSPEGSGCAIRLVPPSWISRAAITSSVSHPNQSSVRTEHPRIMGEAQEQVAGFRPLDEPVRDGNSRPLGTKSHGKCVLREGDKSIDVRADSNSQEIERTLRRDGSGQRRSADARRGGDGRDSEHSLVCTDETAYSRGSNGGVVLDFDARCSKDEDEARPHGRGRSRQDLSRPAGRPQ